MATQMAQKNLSSDMRVCILIALTWMSGKARKIIAKYYEVRGGKNITMILGYGCGTKLQAF